MKTSEVLQEVRPAIIVCSGPDPLSLFIGRPQGGAVLLCNVGAVVHLSSSDVIIIKLGKVRCQSAALNENASGLTDSILGPFCWCQNFCWQQVGLEDSSEEPDLI